MIRLEYGSVLDIFLRYQINYTPAKVVFVGGANVAQLTNTLNQ